MDILNNETTNDFSNLCLGIDFGTTNSCLSIWYKNKSIIIPDIDGNDVIPTVIEINSDKKIIGKQAYLRKEIFESDIVISKKTIFLIDIFVGYFLVKTVLKNLVPFKRYFKKSHFIFNVQKSFVL
jgi:molecular chaperone DnaK (HSP70)